MRTPSDPDTARINANIRRNILANGFTLADVARGLGVSPSAISLGFRGRIGIKRVADIAELIGVTVDDLIRDDDPICNKDAVMVKCPYCGEYMLITTHTQVEVGKIGTR